MSSLPKHMNENHKSTIESNILRAGIQSDYVEDIRPASIDYEHQVQSDDKSSATRNVVAKEVQINLDSESDLNTQRVFFRIIANVDKDNELVNWIRIKDGPNRFVAQAEHAMHKERVSSLANGIDSYLENNY